MGYKAPVTEHEAPLQKPFVDLINRMLEAEQTDDAVAFENLTEAATALSTITVTKPMGDAIDELTDMKFDFVHRIHVYYQGEVNEQHTPDDYKTQELLDKEEEYTNLISRIINRYIFKICLYSWKSGPLRGMVVDVINDLDFDPGDMPARAYNAILRKLEILDLSGVVATEEEEETEQCVQPSFSADNVFKKSGVFDGI